MTDMPIAGNAPETGNTVWREKVSPLDQIPKPIAIAALGLFLVAIWKLVTAAGVVSPIILPSPAQTFAELITVGTNILSGGYMLTALAITTQEVLIGFALAILIRVSLGILVGETTFGERAVMPYLVAIDTMPKIAFAPLFVAWLGFGISSKVALATFVSVFPILVGTAAGMHAADQNAVNLFETMGTSRWQTLIRMKISSGLPHIFTGLKIARSV